MIRHVDGFRSGTMLQNLLYEELGVKTVDEFVHWVNNHGVAREKVAALAPLVLKAASDNDIVAAEILSDQADYLALGVDTLHKRLNFHDRFEVVLSGGLFAESSFYRQIVRRKIMYLLPGADVVTPRIEPVLGSALYAYSIAGINLNEDLLDTIRRSFHEYMKTYSDKKPDHEMTLSANNFKELVLKQEHENERARDEDLQAEPIVPSEPVHEEAQLPQESRAWSDAFRIGLSGFLCLSPGLGFDRNCSFYWVDNGF